MTPSKDGDREPTGSSSKVTLVSPPAADAGDALDAGAEALGAAAVAGGTLSGAALGERDAAGGGVAVGRSQPAVAASPTTVQIERIRFIARFSFGSTANQ
jgi:hypothetical protein